MDLSKYILAVTTAGLICGLVTTLVHTGTAGAVVKMLAGIFLAVTVLRPLTAIRFEEFGSYWSDMAAMGEELSLEGKISAQDEVSAIIKDKAEAYILDKAVSLGAEVTVEVMTESGEVPKLAGVRITGRISPYGKNRLSRIMAEDLGIAKENQIWIG